MKKVEKGLTLTIQGRDYAISCQPEEEADLRRAAVYLEQKLEAIQKRGKVIGTERAVVLAAINVAYEMIQVQEQEKKQKAYEKRLAKLRGEVEHTVDQYRQISL